MSLESEKPAVGESTFEEAVKLVGRKPSGSERKDLITLWGFATKKSWRWCMDVSMTLEEAMEVHRKMAEEMKVVSEKKKK